MSPDSRLPTPASLVEELRQDHKRVLPQLDRLPEIPQHLRAGRTGEAVGALKDFIAFANSALDEHFEKEELELFPQMEKYLGRTGPLTAMMEEHRSIWLSLSALEEKAASLVKKEKPDGAAVDSLEKLLLHIIGLLTRHIEEENTMLFPLAVAPSNKAAI